MWQALLLLNTGISGMWRTEGLLLKCKHPLGPERNHSLEVEEVQRKDAYFFSVWFKKNPCSYF